jgi:hypothetical protein
MGYQGNDAKNIRAKLNGFLRRRIKEIRSLLWSGFQEQEEETAFQEEKMM